MAFDNSIEFGDGIKALREGKKIARRGWNGKGMFLYLVPAAKYPAQTEVANKEFGDVVSYREYIAMKTVDGEVVPWVASQTDVLADDWEIVE